jgi:perosamine synthetase
MVNGAWMPSVMFSKDSGISRDSLINAFAAENVDARVVFWPLSSLGLFKNSDVINPVAFDVQTRSINLPSFHDMTEGNLAKVVQIVMSLIK